MTITLAQILREFALTGRETFRAVEDREVAEFSRKFRAVLKDGKDGSGGSDDYELEPLTVPVRIGEGRTVDAPVLALGHNDTIGTESVELSLATDISLSTEQERPVGADGAVTAESIVRGLLGVGEDEQPQIQATLRDGLDARAARLEIRATFTRRAAPEGVEQIKDRAIAEMRAAANRRGE